jgi:RHS repeat-associated protein
MATPPTGQTWKVYYYAGTQRIAMRVVTSTGGNTLYYLHGDHLGSTSLTTDSNGNRVGELKYYPFGATRYTWDSTPTDRRFTGQRHDSSLGSLYDYGARMYSPAVGRFLSADNIAADPQKPQYLSRYSYVLNQPLRFTDPTGECPKGDKVCEKIVADIETQFGIKLVDGTAIWLTNTAQSILDGLQEMLKQFQAINAKATTDDIKALFGGSTFYRDKDAGGNYAVAVAGTVKFSNAWAGLGQTKRQFYMVHEMGHLWDSRYQFLHWFNNDISQGFAREVGAKGYNCFLGLCKYDPGTDISPSVDHRRDSASEDWAESFASVMIPAMGRSIGPKRTQYVEDEVNQWVTSTFRP